MQSVPSVGKRATGAKGEKPPVSQVAIGFGFKGYVRNQMDEHFGLSRNASKSCVNNIPRRLGCENAILVSIF